MPFSFRVKVDDLSKLAETQQAIEQIDGVDYARAPTEIAGTLTTIKHIVYVAGIVIVGILLVVSMIIISNTIKLTTFDRRDEIAIMKMVGATNGFIRWPFVYEGFIIGLLSAGVAFGLQWLLYATVARSISVSDALNLFSVVDFATIWKPVALVFVGVGMLVGVGGSLTAIRKFLQV